jgi:hypothetical protein
MRTKLKSAHEEQYSDGSKTLGIIFNYSLEVENDGWKESFAFIFNHENNMYIFFDTMFDMFNYLLNGVYNIRCAYMEEDEYDSYYDAPYIEDKFANILKWIN